MSEEGAAGTPWGAEEDDRCCGKGRDNTGLDRVTEVGRKGTQWGRGEKGERIGGEAVPTRAVLIIADVSQWSSTDRILGNLIFIYMQPSLTAYVYQALQGNRHRVRRSLACRASF